MASMFAARVLLYPLIPSPVARANAKYIFSIFKFHSVYDVATAINSVVIVQRAMFCYFAFAKAVVSV
jgi:hypothetical protein